MKGVWIPYSVEQLAWIDANATLSIRDLHREFCGRFDRTDVSAANLNSLRKRRGLKTGRTGRFEKGQTPINKGKPCEPGKGGRHPNARRTHFVKGERRGVAARLYKPIGTERLSKDGYRERKIHDGMPLQSRWRAVHLIEWEILNGPRPKGHALKCLDGDRSNVDPSNWEAVPRALLPRLAGGNRHRKVVAFDEAAPELRPTILALARLEHSARAAKSGDAA